LYGLYGHDKDDDKDDDDDDSDKDYGVVHYWVFTR